MRLLRIYVLYFEVGFNNYILSACIHYGESLLGSVSTALICRSVNAKDLGRHTAACNELRTTEDFIKLRIQNPPAFNTYIRVFDS